MNRDIERRLNKIAGREVFKTRPETGHSLLLISIGVLAIVSGLALMVGA